jgi:hypothetical protein
LQKTPKAKLFSKSCSDFKKQFEHYVIECTKKKGNKNNQKNSKERKARKTS